MSLEDRKSYFGALGGAIVLMLGLTRTIRVVPQTADAPPQPPDESLESKAAPAQPIPFSHKTHVSAGMNCEACHQAPNPGINISLPPTSQCMMCHATLDADHPAIQALAAFDKSGKPVPWARVYSVPSDVFWNHRTHLQAGVKCEECHGDVSQMDEMKVVTNVTVMKGCTDCHEKRGVTTGCAACHEDK